MRIFRRAVVGLLLSVLAAGCQMNVDVTTTLNAGGDGRFRIVFAFDKEFIEVVSSTEEGRASLKQIRGLGEAFSGSGWRVDASEPAGGLRIAVERDFVNVKDLERALAAVGGRSKDSLSFVNVFRDFTLTHEGSFLSTSSRASGSVDLRTERLAPQAKPSAQLESLLKQAAGRVFRFTVRLQMPGKVGAYEGDPTRVDGGTIVWNAPFGQTMRFAARAEGTRVATVAMIIGGIALLLLGAATTIILRRRRAAPVQGWEVASAAQNPTAVPVATNPATDPTAATETIAAAPGVHEHE